MTRIHDVAAAAGVSITTVSHVFSGNRYVAAKTADRVVEVARALNYSPHVSARALATGRSMIFGVCFPAEADVLHRNPYFPALLEGLSTAASRSGYGFLLIPTRFGDANMVQESMTNKLDGVIVVDPNEGDNRLPAFIDAKLPLVTIGRWIGHDEFAWVDNDHSGSFVVLFEHLAERGYRRPLLLTKKASISYEFDIERAFHRQVTAYGMTGRIAWCDNIFNRESYSAAREILHSGYAPDVAIASTDSLALAVLQAANDLGIAVPETLGVVGEGATVLAASAFPPLTTIRVFPNRLGELAVALLLDEIAGTSGKRQLMVPAELLVRASTSRGTSA